MAAHGFPGALRLRQVRDHPAIDDELARGFCYHARTPVESNGVGLEQRLSSLQTQIDHLRHATHDDVRPLEQRLSTLTEYSASILRRWDATADRHARAVSQLEAHLHELGDTGARLQQDASQRLQDLERVVQQEWAALRELHEAPVKQLVEQAATLTEVCIATANSAQHGFDRAEARLAALEADFHHVTSELTREVQAVLTEVRHLASSAGPRRLGPEAPAWPLEDVTRLHHQLRESPGNPEPLHAAAPVPTRHLSVTQAIEHEPVPTGADEQFLRADAGATPRDVNSTPRGIALAAAVILVLVAAASSGAFRVTCAPRPPEPSNHRGRPGRQPKARRVKRPSGSRPRRVS